jgi:CheY-like chemotaxis protein
MRILVVDDFLTMRRGRPRLPARDGLRTRRTSSRRRTARRRSTNCAPRPSTLVITDIEMPILGGFGLLSAIKKDARCATSRS